MLVPILQLIQLFLVFSTITAMVVYHLWYNKPASPVHYRKKGKIARVKAEI